MSEDSKANKRGRIKAVTLKRPISLNANVITKALIEIDHINFGLNKKTGKLNEKKRTDFSVSEIEMFLQLLDGEYLMPRFHKGRQSRFEFRIDCPIKGKFYGKEFLLIFDTDFDKTDEIHTITLFPGW